MRSCDTKNQVSNSLTQIVQCLLILIALAISSATQSTAHAQDKPTPSVLRVLVKVPSSSIEMAVKKVRINDGSSSGGMSHSALDITTWSINWRAQWQVLVESASVETLENDKQGQFNLTVPLRVDLSFSNKKGLARGTNITGCKNMVTEINMKVDLTHHENQGLAAAARKPTLKGLSGSCNLNIATFQISDLRGLVKAAILKQVQAQDIQANVQAALKLTPTQETLKPYLGRWHQLMDAWVRADLVELAIASVKTTTTDLIVGVNASVYPQIMFGDPATAEPQTKACPAPANEFCLPLALVMPRTQVLTQIVDADKAPESNYRLIPIPGQDLSSLRYYNRGSSMDLVFLSGSMKAGHKAGREVSIRSENILAEAASWLAEGQLWPDRKRPAVLNPIYQQALALQKLIERLSFVLDPTTTLTVFDGRVSMSGLLITNAELRANLHLTGKAELKIDFNQL